jgi:hypothetical protein
MCDECVKLDQKIEHYKRMIARISDPLTTERVGKEMSRALLNIAKRPVPRLTLRGVGLTSKGAVS